ncbi:MAG: DUF6036 family nucleotidyltransferase [Acidimicrobiales bacterium]
MNRDAFDHTVRAAAAVLGDEEILVIGSQALHASVPHPLPPEAERSVEVDVVPFRDADHTRADLIDGSIGEASMFHESFGYYAQGVSESTAVLPVGWRDRLVRYESPATNGVVAWCLEVHDLWLSKAAALREKDIDFCSALLDRTLVRVDTLLERLEDMDLPPERRDRVRALVDRSAAGA